MLVLSVLVDEMMVGWLRLVRLFGGWFDVHRGAAGVLLGGLAVAFFGLFCALSHPPYPPTPLGALGAPVCAMCRSVLSTVLGALGALGAGNPANIRPSPVTVHRWCGLRSGVR